MTQCIAVCKTIKVKRTCHVSMYAQGNKWCAFCEVYMKWDGKFCPCCGLQLRTKPKSSHNWQPIKRPWEIVA